MRDSNTRPEVVCAICGGTETVRLPDPASQSMLSDWRIVPAPLAKLSCTTCGLVYRDPSMPPPTDFDERYELYAHAAGGRGEEMRQTAYAEWIAGSITVPRRVLDIGCGNGSLLLALSEQWQGAELTGCDPSPASIRYAVAAGYDVWVGTADDVPEERRAALVVTVNVIEHTVDPRAFSVAVQRALTVDGQLVLICPNGARPAVDLVIADHLFSFTGVHLEALLGDAGLHIDQWSAAPPRLGNFQMVVASRSPSVRQPTHFNEVAALVNAQRDYLEAWRELDAALMQRVPADVVCFGAGEAAGLLRAYAARTWSRVRACATDDPEPGVFGSLPRLPIQDVRPDATVLLAVRPQDQTVVAERLRQRFSRVVTWYDLISF